MAEQTLATRVSKGKKPTTETNGKAVLSKKSIIAADAAAGGKKRPLEADSLAGLSMRTQYDQLRVLLHVAKSVRRGDFSVRMPAQTEGIVSEIGEVLNDIIEVVRGTVPVND